jgi:DNA-binding XRE family transcriptional regulator
MGMVRQSYVFVEMANYQPDLTLCHNVGAILALAVSKNESVLNLLNPAVCDPSNSVAVRRRLAPINYAQQVSLAELLCSGLLYKRQTLVIT